MPLRPPRAVREDLCLCRRLAVEDAGNIRPGENGQRLCPERPGDAADILSHGAAAAPVRSLSRPVVQRALTRTREPAGLQQPHAPACTCPTDTDVCSSRVPHHPRVRAIQGWSPWRGARSVGWIWKGAVEEAGHGQPVQDAAPRTQTPGEGLEPERPRLRGEG